MIVQVSNPNPVLSNLGISSIVDKIGPKLYQGCCPIFYPKILINPFQVIVLCAQELQLDNKDLRTKLFNKRVLECSIDDADANKETIIKADRAAREVVFFHKLGYRILITCRAGRNRSGLVMALTLHHLTGMSGKKAVHLIQSKRANSLTNPAFEEALMNLPARVL